MTNIIREASLFETLKSSCAGPWREYITHPFVRGLGDGSLPRTAFERYLTQDYLFLIHFARAYALAIYKSPTLDDMRSAKEILSALMDEEMGLHVEYCAGWGISEEQMRSEPEAPASMAYTRFVLECGNAGDLLDLNVALAPCVVGYAEVACWLTQQDFTRMQGNPYRSWIEMYAGDGYQRLASGAVGRLDDLGKRLGAPSRMQRLTQIFDDATRLEIGFWQMGLDAHAHG